MTKSAISVGGWFAVHWGNVFSVLGLESGKKYWDMMGVRLPSHVRETVRGHAATAFSRYYEGLDHIVKLEVNDEAVVRSRFRPIVHGFWDWIDEAVSPAESEAFLHWATHTFDGGMKPQAGTYDSVWTSFFYYLYWGFERKGNFLALPEAIYEELRARVVKWKSGGTDFVLLEKNERYADMSPRDQAILSLWGIHNEDDFRNIASPFDCISSTESCFGFRRFWRTLVAEDRRDLADILYKFYVARGEADGKFRVNTSAKQRPEDIMDEW